MRVRVARRVSGLFGLTLAATLLAPVHGSAVAAESMAIRKVTVTGSGWQRQVELHVTDNPGGVSFSSAFRQRSLQAPPYATAADFELVSGTLADGIWRSPTTVTLKHGLSGITTTATAAGHVVREKVTTVEFRAEARFAETTIEEEPVDADHRRVTYRGRVVYTGPDGAELPASGTAYLLVDGFSQSSQVRLDEDGRFSGSGVVRHGGEAFVRFIGTGVSFTTAYSPRTPISGPRLHRTAFTGVTTSPKPVGMGARLTVSARLVRAADQATPVTGAPVDLHFSTDDGQSWTPMGKGTTDAAGNVRVTAVATENGLWWLTYEGDRSAGATDLYAQTSSEPVAAEVWYRTAISSFNAGPEPVRKGKTLTVSGVLKRSVDKTTSFKTWAGQPVYVYYRPTGSKTWKYAGSAKTDRYGKFRKGFKAGKDATWKAVCKGDGDTLRSESATDYVDVR